MKRCTILSITYSLLLIADKYQIKSLVQDCEKEMVKWLDMNNAIDFLNVADQTRANHLKDEASSFIAKNLKSLKNSSKWKQVIKPSADLLNAILQKVD